MSYQIQKNTEKTRAIIVLPFLNEQESLSNSCHSLGFGLDTNPIPRNATLFMIDNGSSDGSLQIAKSISDASPEGSVIIGHEAERGYVPPRHRGNLLAQEYTESNGWRESDTLILQVDADTVYCEGYVEAMRSAAQTAGDNILFQAAAQYPPEFKTTFPEYIQICEKIDNQLEELFAAEATDVIVDDKLSGYWLEDYFKWGGHQREYTLEGDEIHSETARLYIKARAYGSIKSRVEGAQAFPSMRKTIEEPALHFAAAGFPRETSWNEKWRTQYHGPTTIHGLCENLSHPEVQRAVDVRRQHIIAMFGIIPLHISKALDKNLNFNDNALYEKILSMLPKRTINDVKNNPGIFFTDVFHLSDSQGSKLLELLII
jgi:glycosyltransferase involved in cell wall biosynthesis